MRCTEMFFLFVFFRHHGLPFCGEANLLPSGILESHYVKTVILEDVMVKKQKTSGRETYITYKTYNENTFYQFTLSVVTPPPFSTSKYVPSQIYIL